MVNLIFEIKVFIVIVQCTGYLIFWFSYWIFWIEWLSNRIIFWLISIYLGLSILVINIRLNEKLNINALLEG